MRQARLWGVADVSAIGLTPQADAIGIHMPLGLFHCSNFAEDWEQEAVLARTNDEIGVRHACGGQGGTT